LGNV
jgi:hypothetical protein